MRDLLCLLILIAVPAFIGGLTVSPKPTSDGEVSLAANNQTWISPSVLSGPTPSGDAGMQQLARNGIQTIVSVDGARPDVAAARRAGLTYVHLPIGYDGVSSTAVAGLTRVLSERPRPVYVHCHHGQHRGPAAAVICAMIAGEIDHQRAISLLESVGTSPDYPGLWKSVEEYKPVPPASDLPELFEITPVAPLVDLMVRLDERMDEMERVVADSGELSAHVPIKDASSRAVLLHEELREAARLRHSDRPSEFTSLMQKAADQSAAIVQSTDQSREAVRRDLHALRETCDRCHRQFRN